MSSHHGNPPCKYNISYVDPRPQAVFFLKTEAAILHKYVCIIIIIIKKSNMINHTPDKWKIVYSTEPSPTLVTSCLSIRRTAFYKFVQPDLLPVSLINSGREIFPCIGYGKKIPLLFTAVTELKFLTQAVTARNLS